MKLLFLSCLPFLAMVYGKTETDTDSIIQVIMREQASMIKHCMSNVCNRNMYNPKRPVLKPEKKIMVAFSASPIKDITSLAKNARVVFGKVHKNIGNAYNATTGVFTAPVDGVYAFHWSIGVHPNRYSNIYIQVNGENKVYLYGYAKGYPTWYMPSQSYVTDLEIGDTVNLAALGQGDYVSDFSSFTGYRL